LFFSLSLTSTSNFTTAHPQAISAIASDANDTIITCSYDTTCIKYNTQGQTNFTFTMHTAPLQAVLVTWDGTKVISASTDGIVYVWSLSTGSVLSQFSVSGLATMTQLSMMLFATGDSTGNLKVINFWSGALVASLATNVAVTSIQVYEADTVYFGGHSGYVKKWQWTVNAQLYSQLSCSLGLPVTSLFAVDHGSILIQCGFGKIVLYDPTLTNILGRKNTTAYTQYNILPNQYPLFSCKY
jgi:WD40 repeat protein